MEDTVELLLNIARKSFMGADFRQAAGYAGKAKESAVDRQWLEAQKILFSVHRELLQNAEFDKIHQELLLFSRESTAENKARVHYLLAQSYAQKGEWPVVKAHSESSLKYALDQNNHEDIAYALYGVARVSAYQGDFQRAFDDLKKLDTLLENRPKPEIEVAVLLLKMNLFMKQNKVDFSIQQAWQAYELAKRAGFYVYIPMILSTMAYLHVEKESFSEAQSFLALAEKGVTEDQQPLLFKFLQHEKARLEKLAPKVEYDLVVDVSRKSIQERSLGPVDFRNQHTLLDLALIFLRNPRQPFSKEHLIEKIWGQSYDPGQHDNLIYVTVKRLRTLIEPNPENPRYILRNRQGYYFNDLTSILIKEEQAG